MFQTCNALIYLEENVFVDRERVYHLQNAIGIIYYCVILRLIAGRKGAGKYAKPPILSCQFTLHQENCIMGSNLKSLNYTSNYSSHTK